MRRAPHSPQRNGKTVVSAVDWLGNRFHVGDKVLYCIGAGRGQMMAYGEVLKITADIKMRNEYVETEDDDPDWVNDFWDPPRNFRLLKHEFDDVRVQVRTLKTSGHFDNQERTKPAWVNAMNITSLRTVGTA